MCTVSAEQNKDTRPTTNDYLNFSFVPTKCIIQLDGYFNFNGNYTEMLLD